ncbi:MAG: hypothetical protein WCE44_15210 [Candidatus Velthaea sp.]
MTPPALAEPVTLPAVIAYVDSAPGCRAADIAVTDLSAKVIKQHGKSDHYLITGNVKNVGHHTQAVGTTQRVELVRDGKVLAPEPIPALDADVSYIVSFSLDRPVSERGKPLVLTLRYVLDDKSAPKNDCSNANDSLTKTF